MAVAGILEIQLMASVARLADDMSQAKGHVSRAMSSIESSVASAKNALGALGIGLSVGYFASLIKGSIDAADHLNDLTQSLGINMRELAKYKLATDQSGTSLEGLGKGIKGLINAFAEHGDELRKAGITAKTADGQVRQLAEIFSKMPDGVEKTTLAVKLFGKSGMELIPMLNMGAAGLDVAADKSAKYAAVMADLGPRADQFNDTMVELGMASKVAGMSLISDALPAMTGIAAAMAAAAQESGSLKAAWVGLGGIGWEGLFKPLIALIKGATANLMELNAGMLKFFGANEGAAYEYQRAARIWKEIAALETNPPKPADPTKTFDTAAWTAQYKKLVEALGLGKKATEDSDSAYRGLIKTLKEKLLTDKDMTEVNKVQLALGALSAKQLETITPEREAELKTLARQVDLKNQAKAGLEAWIKVEEEALALQKEVDDLMASRAKVEADAILTAEKTIEQIEFETTLIGKSNVERETAIALRTLETSGITKQDAAYEQLVPRIKAAIEAQEGVRVKQEELRNQVSAWTELSQAAGQFFGDLVMHGRSAFNNLKQYLKSFLQQLIAIFAQRWILQIAAGATGSAALGNAAASTGANTLGGAVMSGLSSWFTSTAIGTSLSGMASSYMAGYSGATLATGLAGPTTAGASGATGFGAWMGSGGAAFLGWAALIVAGVYANAGYFSRGYTTRNNPGLATVFPEAGTDRILQALGVSERWASYLTGSSGLAYLFGHGATHADAGGIRGTVTGSGFSGSTFQDFSQRGGLFTSDRRWTDTAAMTSAQSKPFEDAMKSIHDQMLAVGTLLGVDAGKLLENYTKQMDIWLTNKTPEEAKAAIADFFNSVFVEQVGIVAGAAKGPAGAFIADFIHNFAGTTQELADQVSKYLTALAQLVDIQKGITDLIAAVNDPMQAFKNQLKGLDTAVTDANTAFDAALKTRDPTVILAAEQTLQAAIINRYTTERDLLNQLVDQLANLKQEAFNFSLGLAQRYNAAGGHFDIAGASLGRANDIRGSMDSITDPARRITAVNNYVSTLDTWYNERKNQINADIANQNAAAQAAAAIENARRQAEITGLQTQLQLIQQWESVLGQAKQMLDSMRLTSANPLAASGRLGLSVADTNTLFAQFQAATGSGKADLASQLLGALQGRLGLLQETSQRPSGEYQLGYNEIIAMISEVQGVAQTQADRAMDLQQQIADLQARGNVVAEQFSAENSAQMTELNTQYREGLVWAESTGRAAYIQQEETTRLQIEAITGGMDVNLYLAKLQTESLAALWSIDTRLGDYLMGPPIAMPKPTGTPAPGTSSQPKSGALGGDIYITVNATSGDGEAISAAVVKVVRQHLPQLKREMQNA